MTPDIEFFIPGNPQSLKRHRTFKRGDFVGSYDPSKTDKADFLVKAMEHRPPEPYREPLTVRLLFRFQRPKNHYGTGKNAGHIKESAPYWHTGTPDLDNLIKFVCDSLNGIFWEDDRYICNIMVAKKYVTYDSPGVSISIERIKPAELL